MLPVAFLFCSMTTPPHLGHLFSRSLRHEPNTRIFFHYLESLFQIHLQVAIHGQIILCHCQIIAFRHLVIASGDPNLHCRHQHHHRHHYQLLFYHPQQALHVVEVRELFEAVSIIGTKNYCIWGGLHGIAMIIWNLPNDSMWIWRNIHLSFNRGRNINLCGITKVIANDFAEVCLNCHTS